MRGVEGPQGGAAVVRKDALPERRLVLIRNRRAVLARADAPAARRESACVAVGGCARELQLGLDRFVRRSNRARARTHWLAAEQPLTRFEPSWNLATLKLLAAKHPTGAPLLEVHQCGFAIDPAPSPRSTVCATAHSTAESITRQLVPPPPSSASPSKSGLEARGLISEAHVPLATPLTYSVSTSPPQPLDPSA